MDLSLIAIGLSKVLFGVVVGAAGITTSARMVKRFIGLDEIDAEIRKGNIAIGTALAGSVFAMGLLILPCVTATFSALEMLRLHSDKLADTLWIFAYAIGLPIAALMIGTAVFTFGVRVAVRLTPQLDEIKEIREGNVASAILLVSILLVLALLASEGLETLLTGFIPLPSLGRNFPN